jgi:hypothetical protein
VFSHDLKVSLSKYYLGLTYTKDNFGNIVVWSQLESGLAIFASCLPSLNKLISISWSDEKVVHPLVRADQTIGGTPMPMLSPSQTKGVELTPTSSSLTVGDPDNGLSDDNSTRALRLDTLWEHDSV